MMGRKQLITVFMHIKLAIRRHSLNWCAGKRSYILTLSYGLEGKASCIQYTQAKAAHLPCLEWTYLKVNRRIHGTLHNLPKHPPSVDSGNWLTAG